MAFGQYSISTSSDSTMPISWDGTTTGTYTGTFTNGIPSPTECDLMGHKVEKWAEYLDGECVGACSACMVRVQSKRMPGGMPFMRLKALMEMLIASPDNAELILEINEITDLLDSEERAMEEARALLVTARKMARCDE